MSLKHTIVLSNPGPWYLTTEIGKKNSTCESASRRTLPVTALPPLLSKATPQTSAERRTGPQWVTQNTAMEGQLKISKWKTGGEFSKTEMNQTGKGTTDRAPREDSVGYAWGLNVTLPGRQHPRSQGPQTPGQSLHSAASLSHGWMRARQRGWAGRQGCDGQESPLPARPGSTACEATAAEGWGWEERREYQTTETNTHNTQTHMTRQWKMGWRRGRGGEENAKSRKQNEKKIKNNIKYGNH